MSLDVKFSATDAGFTSTVSKVKTSVKSMDDSVSKTASSVKTSFGSMVKAGAGLALGFGAIKMAAAAIGNTLGTFKDALDLGGTMSDLSARTGETAGNLLLLRRAFDNSGVGADKVGASVNKLQKFMDDAAQGSEKNNTTLARLGLTMADMAGKTPTEQMGMLADKLNGVTDDGTRAALAIQIFGKSGGLLLPMLADFSGEMQTAKEQLGSMPKVFDLNAKAFDAISDNITVAKGKFMEFAAGLLTSIAPALELVTDLFTRFDAAGAGMKLGEILTGASNAMSGFSDALSAVRMGEFGLAFKITFESIKLQIADSINSIFANVMAAVKASVTFILTAFGPGSGIFTIIGAQFDILAAKFTKSMVGGAEAIAEALNIPFVDFSVALQLADRDISQAQNKISNSMEQIAGDFILAGKEAGKAYDDALSSSKELIDTSQMNLNLKKLQTELQVLERKALEEANAAALEKIRLDELQIKIGDDRVTNEQRIKELDADIAAAKSSNNKEQMAALEAEKAYYLEFEASKKRGLSVDESVNNAIKARSEFINNIVEKNEDELEIKNRIKQLEINIAEAKLDGNEDYIDGLKGEIAYYNELIASKKRGLSLDEAVNNATKARDDFYDNIVEKNKKITQELEKQLGLGKQIQADARAAESKNRRDPGGRLEAKAREAIGNQDFNKARRIGRQIEDREFKQDFLDEFGKGDVNKLAKKEGIDTFRKNKKEIQQELMDKRKADEMKKRQEEMKPGAEGKKGDKPGEAPKPPAAPENLLQKSVDAIKTAVEKLEKKLPMPALGA